MLGFGGEMEDAALGGISKAGWEAWLLVVLTLSPWMAWGGGPSVRLAESDDFGEEQPGAVSVGLNWLFDGFNRIDAEGEALIGSDITVLRTSGAYEQQRDDLTVGVTLGYTDIDIDYRELGVGAADRSESNREAQVELAWEAGEHWQLTAVAGLFDGFPDYRSVWIAEYYQQLFGFVPGFRGADPSGWSVGVGAGWDLVPGATRIAFNLGYGEDEIVQGWTIGRAGLEAGPGRLETTSGAIVLEQAINGWSKMENSLRVRHIALREPRVQIQSNWAVALGPAWTLRASVGATRERPSFEAYFVGGSIDFEFLPGWHAALNARYYEDTGEIESAGFSTAAPGMQAFELGASLLYDKEGLAVRLSGGFYNTDLEPLDPTNDFFGNLYRDRDWWLARAAVSYSF